MKGNMLGTYNKQDFRIGTARLSLEPGPLNQQIIKVVAKGRRGQPVELENFGGYPPGLEMWAISKAAAEKMIEEFNQPIG